MGRPDLEALLVVQAHDLALDRLEHRRVNLAERGAIAEVMSELVGLNLAEGISRIGRQALARSQAALEAEAEALGARVAQIEGRLYGGSVSAPRELSAMAAEAESLRQQRSVLEDRVLEAMAEAEPMDAQLDGLASRRRDLEAEQGRLLDQLGSAELVIEAEVAVERGARQELAGGLPEALRLRYEDLRARLGGIGAARVDKGTCGGCHLALAAVELERLRRLGPEELVTCEQCGRILVPPAREAS